MARHSFAGAPAQTALTGSIGPTDTTIAVGDTTGWPDTAVGPFVIVIDPGIGSEEKILIDSYASTVLTVGSRGYDGTSEVSHDPGVTGQVVCCLDATQFDFHDEVVNNVGTVTPSASAVGDSAADGTHLTSPAAGDHVHGRESFGTSASASAVGDTESAGSASTPSRSDHKHGRETAATLTSGLVYGTSASLSAPGDTEIPGSATTPSRSDHKHGRLTEAYPTLRTVTIGSVPPAGTPLLDEMGDVLLTATSGAATWSPYPWGSFTHGYVLDTWIADGGAGTVNSIVLNEGSSTLGGAVLEVFAPGGAGYTGNVHLGYHVRGA